MVGEHSLYNHYKHHTDLMFHKVLTLTEINDLMPFERNIYLELWNGMVEATNKE